MIRDVAVGAGSPVAVQSMSNVESHDEKGILRQISELEEAGCEIVRMAVPDKDAHSKLQQQQLQSRLVFDPKKRTRYGIDFLPYDFNPVKYHKTTRHTFLHHQLDIFPTSSFLLHLHINSSQRGYSCETIEGKTVISHPNISPYRFRIVRFPY